MAFGHIMLFFLAPDLHRTLHNANAVSNGVFAMDGSGQAYPDCIQLSAGADVPASVYGARAAAIVALRNSDLPLPRGWAFSIETVRGFARGAFPSEFMMDLSLNEGRLFSVRASAADRAWGGPSSLLNIGMNASVRDQLIAPMGTARANGLFFRFVQNFSVQVARLDSEDFDDILTRTSRDGVPNYAKALDRAFALYEDEMDAAFPSDPTEQLRQALRSMASTWNGASARILRSAQGAPADAGLGLIVQEMVLGVGRGEFGAGIAQFVSSATGEKSAQGRYLSQGQGRDALNTGRRAQFLSKDPRGASLEEICPEGYAKLQELSGVARASMRDDVQLEFTIEDGEVWLLDAIPAERNGRAAVAIAVRLAEDKILSKAEALCSIAPRRLNEVLHPQIDPKAVRDVFAKGIGASPGAATGQIVFSAAAAQAAEARGEPCILVRVETSPDDIRGMHSSRGILTERGGITSHAAVVARGLGLPCVVGASGIDIDVRAKRITLADGSILTLGDTITLDGAAGEVMRGAPDLMRPDLGGDFLTFMDWADEVRTLGIRGNADTPHDVRMALSFGVDGIGLVRTEHMFSDENRLTAMREVIFADTNEDRVATLNEMLPMQRNDFIEMFSLMGDKSMCVRLLDPPLHEFLPHSREETQALAEALDLPLSKVTARIEDLSEFNPMLGMRGVRLGITAPEIYEMQTRAIIEAAIAVKQAKNIDVKPEIMIPLISATKEVEIVKARVDAVAASVQSEKGERVGYSVGVMVETPRAALRAHDIARSTAFISFGTNDLTQMTYGLSRDDAGRFMREYVNSGVFHEDPFHSLDLEGVGELMELATERGRGANADLKVGLCGEHGGDPASVAFCHQLRFDYVSCSPFRTPIARLAAAQAALATKVPT